MLASSSLGRTPLRFVTNSRERVAQLDAASSCPSKSKVSARQCRLLFHSLLQVEQPSSLWDCTHTGPWTIQHRILNVTSAMVGCSHCTSQGWGPWLSSNPLTLQLCICRGRWAGEGSLWGWRNPLDVFGPHKEMQPLAWWVLLGCPKTQRRNRSRDSPRLEPESTANQCSFHLVTCAVVLAAPPSPHSLLLKD